MPARRTPARLRQVTEKAARGSARPMLAEVGEPPSWLPEAARLEWVRVVELTEAYSDWVTAADRAALTAYCASFATYEAAAMAVAEQGPVVAGRGRNDDGRQVKNPAAQVMRDSGLQLRQWARELGLTPDSRGRVDRGMTTASRTGAARLLT